jgi:glycine dehydrogenase subunit 1
MCQAARQAGALAIVAVNDPVSLAVLEAPGVYGADLVCGEAQPVGLPLSFGGPYVGFLAARQGLLRRMPGRLVGLTEDAQGRRGFCLTLQAREQHIRREKASSNICSNQGLCALAVTVNLALLGPEGLRRCALGSMSSAAFARERLSRVPGFSLAFSEPGFHEFVLRCPVPPEQLLEGLAERGILGGYALGRDYPEFCDCLLVCCSELTRQQEVEELALALEALAHGAVEVTR